MKHARIIGTGSYLPERVLDNAALEKLVETSDDWIVERTGVRRRHIAAEHETTADLAEHAARAGADHGPEVRQRQHRQAARGAHVVAGAGEVGGGVDQRAVEIEQHGAHGRCHAAFRQAIR